MKNASKLPRIHFVVAGWILFSFSLILLSMAIYPIWNVWRAQQAGKAELKRITLIKQLVKEQATAEKDAAYYRAEAIRTEGSAAAEYPEYRKNLFYGALSQSLEDGNISQVIYIPTEAGLPITEAMRFKGDGIP